MPFTDANNPGSPGSINIPIIYLPPLLRGKVGALYFRMNTVTVGQALIQNPTREIFEMAIAVQSILIGYLFLQ